MSQKPTPQERPPPNPLLPVAQRQNKQLKSTLKELQRLTEEAVRRDARIARLEALLDILLTAAVKDRSRDHRQST